MRDSELEARRLFDSLEAVPVYTGKCEADVPSRHSEEEAELCCIRGAEHHPWCCSRWEVCVVWASDTHIHTSVTANPYSQQMWLDDGEALTSHAAGFNEQPAPVGTEATREPDSAVVPPPSHPLNHSAEPPANIHLVEPVGQPWPSPEPGSADGPPAITAGQSARLNRLSSLLRPLLWASVFSLCHQQRNTQHNRCTYCSYSCSKYTSIVVLQFWYFWN